MAQLLRDFVKVENDFTIIPNEILRNKEMKSSTKNILLTMFSLPPNWDFSIAGIATCVKEGRDNVQKALVELEKIGYITRKRERKPNGTLGVMIYTIHQFPVSEDKNTYKKNFCDNQHTEKPKQVKPTLDSEAQLRTDSKLNTNCSIGDTENNNSNLDNIDLLSTDNSLSTDKDNSKTKVLDLHNSPVSEKTKQETHISKTLGRKTHTPKQAPLKDMPTRAREIADRLVDDTETADKVSECISYFLEQYKTHMHKEHIHLTNDKLHDVIVTMLSAITIKHENDGEMFESDYSPLVADNVDIDDMHWVIDQYFETQFREKTDYSLVHFTQEGVLTNVMNKCMLGGNPWYQSHSL